MSLERPLRPPRHRRWALPRTRLLPPSICACVVAILLASCGSSSHPAANSSSTTSASSTTTDSAATTTTAAATSATSGPPGAVLARVGRYRITRRLLAQWMAETVAGDFYTVTSHIAPLGLVAEPADYPECVAELHKLTPIPGKGPPQPQPTTPQLQTKCQELYETVKHQAMENLVSAYWSKNYDAARGITLTPTETQHEFNRIATEQYPKPGSFQQFLANNRRTLTQQQFLTENELLSQKVINKLTHDSTQAANAFNSEAEHNGNNATCQPGYIVAHCKGYQPPKERFSHTNKGAPDITLEEIGRWRPETSHGFTGQRVTF
jgi:hypothetical protein